MSLLLALICSVIAVAVYILARLLGYKPSFSRATTVVFNVFVFGPMVSVILIIYFALVAFAFTILCKGLDALGWLQPLTHSFVAQLIPQRDWMALAGLAVLAPVGVWAWIAYNNLRKTAAKSSEAKH